VSTDKKGWIAARFTRLSTGLKMLLILSLALFPIGLMAVLASIESARQKNADRTEETLARLEIKAQQINAALSRSVITINTASAAISYTPPGSEVCETTLRRLERGPAPARYALYASDGTPRCASTGLILPAKPPRAHGPGTLAEISQDGEALRLNVFGETGILEGIGESTPCAAPSPWQGGSCCSPLRSAPHRSAPPT